jgi:hypothetical protein
MTAILAFLLFTTLGARIPTDAEIAGRIEASIREQYQPDAVTVTVRRRTPLSTTMEEVEIRISGFRATSFPFLATGPAQTQVAMAAAAPLALVGGERGEMTLVANLTPDRKPAKMMRVVQGRLICERFVLQSLPVQRIELTATEARIPRDAAETGKLSIAAADRLEGYVLLNQTGVTTFLRTLDTLPITDPVVTFTNERATITGSMPWVVRVPIEVNGTVGVRDGAVLYLDQPTLKFSIVNVPQFIADRVLQGVNPLVDLNAALHLTTPLTLTRATLGEGTLRLEGTMAFPKPE